MWHHSSATSPHANRDRRTAGSISALDEVCSKPQSKQNFCKTGQQFPTLRYILQEIMLQSNICSFVRKTADCCSTVTCVIPNIVADIVSPSYIFSFQLQCLTRVRPPTKAVRIHQLWFICIDASDSLFCPSVICRRETNTGSCDSREGSSVNFNFSRGLISARLQIYSQSWS